MIPAVMGFVLGLILGSFAKATAGRIITGKALRGRSYCNQCKHTLAWYDLFPVFSYLFLKGRCRYCHKKIPAGDFWTEIIMGIALALLFTATLPRDLTVFTSFNYSNLLILADLTFKSFIVVVLAIIFWIDLKTGLIPDRITYPGIVISALYLVAVTVFKSGLFYQNFFQGYLAKYLLQTTYLQDHLRVIWISAGWTFLSTILATLFFVLLIVGTKGKGMGWGDVKYVLFLGLALGFPINIVGLFLAFLLGAVASLVLIAVNKKHFGQTVPFGPFLSLGAYIALVWGSQLLDYYLKGFRP